jgi:heptosyltransferase-2
LISKTTPAGAFGIIQYINLMISEDSGLMHMAYLSGKSTVGLLGSTRADWTDPKLNHTFFFTSSDLPCGNCMLNSCKMNTTECLTRVKPGEVVKRAIELLSAAGINISYAHEKQG